MTTVFLSSTFADMKFERRALSRAFEGARFEILKMEDVKEKEIDAEFFKVDSPDPALAEVYAAQKADAMKGFNPFSWSIEQVKKCDVLVHIIGNSLGSIPPGFGQPYVHYEIEGAFEADKPILAYRLNRPFPDDADLLEAGESFQDLQASRRPSKINSNNIVDLCLGPGSRPIHDLFLTSLQISVSEINTVAQLRNTVVIDINQLNLKEKCSVEEASKPSLNKPKWWHLWKKR